MVVVPALVATKAATRNLNCIVEESDRRVYGSEVREVEGRTECKWQYRPGVESEDVIPQERAIWGVLNVLGPDMENVNAENRILYHRF